MLQYFCIRQGSLEMGRGSLDDLHHFRVRPRQYAKLAEQLAGKRTNINIFSRWLSIFKLGQFLPELPNSGENKKHGVHTEVKVFVHHAYDAMANAKPCMPS